MIRLSPRERTLLRWALAAAALYLLFDLAVLPYWDSLDETRARAEIQAKRVRNYREILKRQEQIEAELETLRRQTEFLEQGCSIVPEMPWREPRFWVWSRTLRWPMD